MREYLSIDVLSNWIRMLRADLDGAIWLADDEEEARFYETCAHKAARVIPTSGFAFPLLNRVEEDGIRGVVASFRGTKPRNAPNIFVPSIGDVASLLFMSDACEKVIRDLSGEPWFTAGEKEIGSIRKRIGWIASVYQQIQQACLAEHIAVPEELITPRIIDWAVFEIAWDRVSEALVNQGLSADKVQKFQKIGPSRELRSDLAIADGMDAIKILAAAMRMYCPRGISSKRYAEPTTILSMLRLGFDFTEFETDDVFWQMRRWERTNLRYPLLRYWRVLDPLGIVWDQRYWENDLSAMLKMLNPGEQLGVFKMDLDNFKAVNEALGHSQGDHAIRLYCSVVKTVLGNIGEVYRRGGDEVVVLAPLVSEQVVRDLAEKTRAEVEARFLKWAAEVKLFAVPTASIGAVVVDGDKPMSEVISLMDEAQRRAKEEGKNRVVFLS